MGDDNPNNVRSLPLTGEDVLRHAVEAFKEYMHRSAPDPHGAELALFDQIVTMQLSYQRDPDEAIRIAQTVIRARRMLAALPADPVH